MSKTSMKKNISKIAFFFFFYNSLLSYSFLLFFYTHTDEMSHGGGVFQKATTLLPKKHVFFAFRKYGVCFKRMVP